MASSDSEAGAVPPASADGPATGGDAPDSPDAAEQSLGGDAPDSPDAAELSLGGDAPDSPDAAELSLGSEVDALLAAHASLAVADGVDVGQSLGPYRLLERLGEGGFGTVFLAEQREPVKRRVALKVVKLGMDTHQVIARFEAERQALAMMEHGNIARALDVGVTGSGRPFFVMELVRGVPITEYCRRNQLDLAARLALFVPVCHALQHAHHKGVVHRDIKPSNVLVTVDAGAPVPKVIDFGIAKAMHHELTELTLITLQAQILGTPAYMSPEQADQAGLDVDTRSDIYSLGVLLYQLLTGETPFSSAELLNAGHAGMLAILADKHPVRPSARVAQLQRDGATGDDSRSPEPQLARKLEGDLDWIVMKCLEKDRTRRYDSAAGLAADVQRHLSCEPVAAGPPSTRYRLGKFVRRNRRGVIVASVSLGLLLLAGVGALLAMLWALDERERADQLARSESSARVEAQQSADAALLAAARAEEASLRAEVARADADLRAGELLRVSGFQQAQLSSLDAGSMGLQLRDGLIAEVLRQARFDRLSAAQRDQRSRELTDLLSGVSFTDLGLAALEQRVLGPALSAVDEQFADQPLLRARMQHTLAGTMADVGLVEAAFAAVTLALDTRREQLGPDAADTLDSLSLWGSLMKARGFLAEALAAHRECVRGRSSASGPDARDTLRARADLANVLAEMGRLDEALAEHMQLLDARLRVLGDDADTYSSHADIGSVLYSQGDYAAAEQHDRLALTWRREHLGEDDPDTLASRNNLGVTLKERRRFEEAVLLNEGSLAAARGRYGDRHQFTLRAASNLGGTLRSMGRLDAAEALFEETLLRRRELLGNRHRDTLLSVGNLGVLRYDQGRYEEAEPLLAEAWRGLCETLQPEHFQSLQMGATLASVAMRLGRRLQAAPILVEVTSAARRAAGGTLDRATERLLVDAKVLAEQLMDDFNTLNQSGAPFGDQHLELTNAVAALFNVQQRFREAAGLLTMIEAPAARVLGRDHPGVLECGSLLGAAHAGSGSFEQAQAGLLAAHAGLEALAPGVERDRALTRSARRLVELYQAWGRPADSEPWRRVVQETLGGGER